MRNVTVNVTVKLSLNIDEGVEVSKVIEEMDYDFTSGLDSADVADTEIISHEVTDSR